MIKTLTYIIKPYSGCFNESYLTEIKDGFSGIIYTVNAIKICLFAIRKKDIRITIINDSMIHSGKIHA